MFPCLNNVHTRMHVHMHVLQALGNVQRALCIALSMFLFSLYQNPN